MSEKSAETYYITKQLYKLRGQLELLSRLCDAYEEDELESKLRSILREIDKGSSNGQLLKQAELVCFYKLLNEVYFEFIDRH